MLAAATTSNAQPPAKSDKEPIRQFIMIDIHLYNVGASSLEHEVSMGSGLSLDFNLMKYFLVHMRALGTYFEGFGAKGDLGLGVVFHGYSGRTEYTQAWGTEAKAASAGSTSCTASI